MVWVNQFLVKYTCYAKTSNFVENFGLSMVRFGSIRVSSPFSEEHISDVGSGMGPGCLVRVSGLKSVLPGHMPQNIMVSLTSLTSPSQVNPVAVGLVNDPSIKLNLFLALSVVLTALFHRS